MNRNEALKKIDLLYIYISQNKIIYKDYVIFYVHKYLKHSEIFKFTLLKLRNILQLIII